jgi:hypothetical protein
MLSSFRGKSCSNCGCFISPPEDSKGPADTGFCPGIGKTNERSCCSAWQAIPEEA